MARPKPVPFRKKPGEFDLNKMMLRRHREERKARARGAVPPRMALFVLKTFLREPWIQQLTEAIERHVKNGILTREEAFDIMGETFNQFEMRFALATQAQRSRSVAQFREAHKNQKEKRSFEQILGINPLIGIKIVGGLTTGKKVVINFKKDAVMFAVEDA